MLEEKAREIVAELVGSEEFAALQQTRREVEKNIQLKELVDQYFRDTTDSFNSPVGPDEALMQRRFGKMMQTPEIAAYFEAGHKFDMIVFKVHQLIDNLLEQKLNKK